MSDFNHIDYVQLGKYVIERRLIRLVPLTQEQLATQSTKHMVKFDNYYVDRRCIHIVRENQQSAPSDALRHLL